jgi:hypothetical protein
MGPVSYTLRGHKGNVSTRTSSLHEIRYRRCQPGVTEQLLYFKGVNEVSSVFSGVHKAVY